MSKIYKVFLYVIFITFSLNSYSHVNHYENLKKIEFGIYRNSKFIGTHVFSFKKESDNLSVDSEIKFIIKKLGVTLYKYHVKGKEVYDNDGKLIKFNSKTNQNGKEKYVKISLIDNKYIIDGSSFKGEPPADFIIGTWWNHSITKAKSQISAVSGRVIEQKVTFIGKEKLNLNGKEINALRFNFSSVDTKLKKDKKLNTDVWYDEKSLNWIKATFKKKGNWEYKLISIN